MVSGDREMLSCQIVAKVIDSLDERETFQLRNSIILLWCCQFPAEISHWLLYASSCDAPIPFPEASVAKTKQSSGEGMVRRVCSHRASLRESKACCMGLVQCSLLGDLRLVTSVRGRATEENPGINHL